MAPYDGHPWPRYPRTLPGAWSAIFDLREELDRMASADMIEAAAKRGAQQARSQWLTTGRGLFASGCLAVTALAAIATAAHSWVA